VASDEIRRRTKPGTQQNPYTTGSLNHKPNLNPALAPQEFPCRNLRVDIKLDAHDIEMGETEKLVLYIMRILHTQKMFAARQQRRGFGLPLVAGRPRYLAFVLKAYCARP
jgi:hypothetical protein